MSQMPVHSRLIEAKQEVPLITVIEHRLIANPHRQENMPAPDDRLVSVVSIEVQTSAHKDPGENVPRGGNALACGATNCQRKVKLSCAHRDFPFLQTASLKQTKKARALVAASRNSV
jgi:hypothetical protein